MNKLKQIVLMFIVVFALTVPLFAAVSYWNGTTSDNWNTASKWSNGVPTGGMAYIANNKEIVFTPIGTANSLTSTHFLVGQNDSSETAKVTAQTGKATIAEGFTYRTTDNTLAGRNAATGTLDIYGTLNVSYLSNVDGSIKSQGNLIVGMVNNGKTKAQSGVGYINLLGNATVTIEKGSVLVGGGYNESNRNGVGVLTVGGNSTLNVSNGTIFLGRYEALTTDENGGIGTLTVKENATIKVTNDIALATDVKQWVYSSEKKAWVEEFVSYGGQGTFNLEGGSVTARNLTAKTPTGHETTSVNISGGSLTLSGNLTTISAPFTMSGGSVKVAGTTSISGTNLNIADGSFQTSHITLGNTTALNISNSTFAVKSDEMLMQNGASFSGSDLYVQKIFKMGGGNYTLADTQAEVGFFFNSVEGTINLTGNTEVKAHRVGLSQSAEGTAATPKGTVNFIITNSGAPKITCLSDATSSVHGTDSSAGDAFSGYYYIKTAGFGTLSSQTVTFISQTDGAKVRNDKAAWSLKNMKLNESSLFDWTRTFKVGGVQKTDQGGDLTTNVYTENNVTDLNLSATLKASAKIGTITVSGTSVDVSIEKNGALGTSGWFEVKGDGNYNLELTLDGVTNWDDFVTQLETDSAGGNEVSYLGENTMQVSMPTMEGASQYFLYDFSPYTAYGTISLSSITGNAVPEPAAWVLLLVGIFGSAVIQRVSAFTAFISGKTAH